ncbi:MAG TPA: NAD-dependent epimerase/dehydratase family protein [Longimicrobiales bacterium]|nr:NAD-dependent epimerase/dehydratase family protein [Longimicrobiales bacterium]
MSVLVTGAAGFIGSHLSEALVARGETLVCLDSFDPYYDPAVKERNLTRLRSSGRFTEIRGDIRDPAAWDAVPEGVEAVVHLAARAGVRPSIEEPALYADVNVTGTQRMLDFVRERGIGAAVFASSSSVYGNTPTVPFSESAEVHDPISPYAATKLAGELLCRTAHNLTGVSVVAARLFTVYGPRQRPDLAIHKFARLLRAGRPLPRFGDGSTARDYTFVGDLVSGLIASLDLVRSGPGRFEVVNLGSDRPVTLNELIGTLAEELGVDPVVEQLPPQPGDVERTWADISRARAVLGYDPRTPFREGIRRFVGWMESA